MATGRSRRSGSPAARVTEHARRTGVRLVRFLYTDNGGVTRGKSTHVESLGARLTDGIGLTVAMQAMNMLDQLQPVEGLGPVGEIRLMPDPRTFTVLPYAPPAAAMTSDMCTLGGAPWEACPRAFLKRQIDACAAAGFSVRAAFECEFTLAVRNPDGSFAPLDESLCFSTTGMTTAAPVIDEMVAALEAQGRKPAGRARHPALPDDAPRRARQSRERPRAGLRPRAHARASVPRGEALGVRGVQPGERRVRDEAPLLEVLS